MLTTAVQGKLCGRWVCTHAHRHDYTLTALPTPTTKLLQQLLKVKERTSLKVWEAVS